MSAWVKTPRFLPRMSVFAVLLTLFFTFSFAIPTSAADIVVVDDNPPGGCQANAAPFCNIQPAIDAASEGNVIKVYPGDYNEAATSGVLVQLRTWACEAAARPRAI
jgi:hypothetical protein